MDANNKLGSAETAGEAGEQVWPIPAVYLLHGKGGSPNGTVKNIQTVLERHWPGLEFHRPLLPHSDPIFPAERSVEHLLGMAIPRGALLLGVSLGGTVAAKLQEVGRDDLKVIAISSPSYADGVVLGRRVANRLAFYSSEDDVIATRISEWPRLASLCRNYEWLTHETDQHLKQVVRLFDWYLEGRLPDRIDEILSNSPTRAETDDIVWKAMTEARTDKSIWQSDHWSGVWPRTFAEIGLAIEAEVDWEDAWSGWGHTLMFGKDARSLADEPPTWFPPGRRALLAGAAEFLAKLYDLPIPAWALKTEYTLPESDYGNCANCLGGSEYALVLPETDDEDYRLRAKTPKEMLRRNVIYAARNLTVL